MFTLPAFVFGAIGLIVLGILAFPTQFFTRVTTIEALLFVIVCFLAAIMFGVWRLVALIYNQLHHAQYPPQLRPKQ